MVSLATYNVNQPKLSLSAPGAPTRHPWPRETPMESTSFADLQTLKALIKESLREVLREERLNLCQLFMPYVSDDEQTEIDTALGSPEASGIEEWIDLTNWVKHGGSIQ